MVTDVEQPSGENPAAGDLLPWYVNGSLGVEERGLVERWLRSSSDARAQLQQWQCIAQNVAAIHREDATKSANQGKAATRIRETLRGNNVVRRRTTPGDPLPSSKHRRRKTELFYLTCFGAVLVAVALTISELIRRS